MAAPCELSPQRKRCQRDAGSAGVAGIVAPLAAPGIVAPGITTDGPDAAALAGADGRSSTVSPPLRTLFPAEKNASASVQMKKTVAHTAVERDRKFALPVAPNRLPDAPLPNDAPMSAPLPCWISTRPIIATADRICTISTMVVNSCMRERLLIR